ncbi:MAG TPA: RsmB/NOP family class I SAM-dependent RNA methyltransferase [Candidatus Acidoferrum sp.]|jgi:NOL1/NOP2/sun family putative RNA methylase|nr:RsmB/NOP family class I SAM-dependent RNA methyltransferase [Candidatus Acidoferrum sp.]
MSGQEFFINRYRELGWEYAPAKPMQAIRVNTTNARREDIEERLGSQRIRLKQIPFANNGYWVCKSRVSVGATSEYLLGLYSIQEAAAQIPVTFFSDLRGKIVLDACAAPGGKTVQLADLMKNTGAVVALDIDRQRLTALSNHLERCSVKNTIVYKMDARHASRLQIKFDRVLLDVPCSGNFATDDNWFHRRMVEDVERNAALQREILEEAAKVMKDNGEIVYSTCSLEPEEDELNIDWAIKNMNLRTESLNISYGEKGLTKVFGKKLDSSVENCRRIWPEKTQGFFVCKLVRRSDA